MPITGILLQDVTMSGTCKGRLVGTELHQTDEDDEDAVASRETGKVCTDGHQRASGSATAAGDSC